MPNFVARTTRWRCPEGAADQFLVGVRTINVGGIEKRDSEVERASNGGEGFLFVAVAIKIGHAHAAESDRGNKRAASTKFSLFHVCPIQVRGAIFFPSFPNRVEFVLG